MSTWSELEATTFTSRLFIAGSADVAKEVCRDYCFNIGLCVNIKHAEFVYSAGQESGVCVELINYPRFPKSASEIYSHLREIGFRLADKMFQRTFSIETPDKTVYFYRKLPFEQYT